MIIAEIFTIAALFLLASLGLSVVVRGLSSALLGEKRRCLLSVVFLDGTDTEYLLRCVLNLHSANPTKGSRRIYAVDCGMKGEDRCIADRMAKKFPVLSLVSLEEFSRMTQELDFEEYKYKAG